MYIVTGCCGFIGSHLCEVLISRGCKLIGIDNMNDYYSIYKKEKNLELLQDSDLFTFIRGDILDSDACAKIKDAVGKETSRPIMFHLAALAGVRNSLENPESYVRVNIEGTTKLLQLCKDVGIDFFYASSSSVYGLNTKLPFSEEDAISSQNSPYAVTKLCTEQMASLYSRLYSVNTCGFRFFTVYGERGRPDMAPYKFIKSILDGEEIQIYGDGRSFRDYTYVGDVVQQILAASEVLRNNNESFCRIYNVGAGNPIYLSDFIAKIEKIVGIPAKIKHIENQKGDVPATYADTSQIRCLTGISTSTSLDEGLERTVKWMRMMHMSPAVDE